MSWIWLNIPLAVVIVAFTVGLPLWVILKYPDDAPDAVRTELASHDHAVSIPDDEAAVKVARERARRAA